MKSKHRSAAFTLVEVLVACAIVVVIMGVLLGMTDQTQKLVKSTSAKVEQFQEARIGFESMTRHLAQATLNTFWDYKYSGKTGTPTGYERKAELRFHSGPTKTLNPGGGPGGALQPGQGVFFQAPIGRVENTVKLGALDHLMNTWGYFLELTDDNATLPQFIKNSGVVPPRKRYRLMELMEPSETLSVYQYQADQSNKKWFTASLTSSSRPVRVLAENIVSLIILPRLSLTDEKRISTTTPPVLAPKYVYDSTITPAASANAANANSLSAMMLNSYNQLPPVVQVIMVAIDEPSARRLEDLNSSDPYLGIGYLPLQYRDHSGGGGKYSGQSLFTDPANLDDNGNLAGDLSKLQDMLTERKVAYRIFSSNVTIKGAKWSLHTATD